MATTFQATVKLEDDVILPDDEQVDILRDIILILADERENLLTSEFLSLTMEVPSIVEGEERHD